MDRINEINNELELQLLHRLILGDQVDSRVCNQLHDQLMAKLDAQLRIQLDDSLYIELDSIQLKELENEHTRI